MVPFDAFNCQNELERRPICNLGLTYGEASIQYGNRGASHLTHETEVQELSMAYLAINKATEQLNLRGSSLSGAEATGSGLLYEPIHEGNLFRLVELLPGKDNDPVQVKLYLHHIDESPPYEAISYVWGDENDSVQIQCNNKIINITKNLFFGLRRFRNPYSPRILWVDSISINQADKVEKGHQVNLMGPIFREAKHVLAWLGYEYSSATSKALDFVKTTTKRFNFEIGSPRTFRSLKIAINNLNSPSHSSWSAHIAAINSIIRNVYFNRVWILQEIGLARTVTLFCGIYDIQLSTLMTFSKILSFKSKSLPRPRLDGTIDGLFDTIWSTFGCSRDTWMKESPTLRLLTKIMADGRLNDGYICDMASILHATSNIEATNPLDRIYALLEHKWARVSGTRAPILQADYTITLTQLNYRLAERLCLVERTLSHLRAVNHTNSDHILESSNSPSWVHQWGELSTSNLVRGFYDEILRCSIAKYFKAEIEANILFCSGLIVDRIIGSKSGPFLHRSDSNSSNKNFEIFQECWNLPIPEESTKTESLVSLFINHGSSRYSSTTFGILMDLIEFLGQRQEQQNAYHVVKRTWNTELEIAIQSGVVGSIGSFSSRLFKHFSSRRFFSTAQGRVGVGPAILQEGDLCCTLFGCDAILILRPLLNVNCYKLVGACTIAGLMDGEIGVLWSHGEVSNAEFALA
jgi:hypothetical protein